MDSLGVLLVAPMNAYLEQELDRRCRLFRLWESPADRRDDYLRAHASSSSSSFLSIPLLPRGLFPLSHAPSFSSSSCSSPRFVVAAAAAAADRGRRRIRFGSSLARGLYIEGI